MKASVHPPRAASQLSDSLHHQLNIYALAASAAGVSLLAVVQPAEAKIVYTKTHQVIGTNGIYPLDLNHDGTIDFLIQEWGSTQGQSADNSLLAKPALGNAVEGSVGTQGWLFAAALKKGALIGPSRDFVSSSGYGAVMAAVRHAETGYGSFGQWLHVSYRYLGLKFKIDGKNHYGWARLGVQVQGLSITATLTGYAYETVAGKGIHAGATQGEAESAISSPDSTPPEVPGPAATGATGRQTVPLASLGHLAVRARGVSLWRRP